MPFPTPAVTTTTAATFIPEIWSDEIVAAYKKNLVAANLVKKMLEFNWVVLTFQNLYQCCMKPNSI